MRKKYRIRRAAKRCRRPSPSKISEWRHRKPCGVLEQIIRGAFGNIIRAKGQFAAGDQFLQFDVADHRYSITGTEQKNAGQAVFIGNDMNEDAIRQYFKKCAGNQKMKYAARHVS